MQQQISEWRLPLRRSWHRYLPLLTVRAGFKRPLLAPLGPFVDGGLRREIARFRNVRRTPDALPPTCH
jgi:hypothetical protein